MNRNQFIALFHSNRWLGLLLFLGWFSDVNGQNRVIWGENPLDSVRLSEAVKHVAANDRINSFLIWKNGAPQVSAYYHGLRPGQKVNVKSVSKSILGILAGIAHDQQKLPDLQTPISPLFNTYARFAADTLKQQITIRHLLTMSPGLLTTSHQYTNWTRSADWVGFVLNQPLVFEPGRTMLYSSGNSHLMGVVLRKYVGTNLSDFARMNLFDPLNSYLGGWDTDPQGYFYGGNNMALSPADLQKIGVMVLNRGMYNGKRIVSEAWIDEMLAPQIRATLGERDAWYGYYWWRDAFKGRTVHFAWGFGGQYLFIVPEEQLVVVFTSILKSTRNISHNNFIYDVMQTFLLPDLHPAATH